MRHVRLSIVLAVFALALYLPTWCPVVTWVHDGADGPELEAAIRSLGVPHPTGYPLLVFLGNAISKVVPPPISALNVLTLLSAIVAVIAVGTATRAVARRLWGTGSAAEGAGLLGGAFFATSLTWWKQVVIGEVYPLHVALVTLALAFLFEGGTRRALLAAWLLGLALANHLQSVPALLVVACYWIVARRGVPPKRALLALLAPIGLYVGLMLRARHDPFMNWGNPDSLRGLWWSLTGAPYQKNLFDGGAEFFFPRLADAVERGLVVQFGWGGLALAVAGLAAAARRASSETLALLLLFAGTNVVAAAYAIPDPAAYYLPAGVAAAVFAGLGAAAAIRAAWRARYPATAWRPAAIGAVLAVVLAGLGAQIARVAPQADAHDDRVAYRYARDGVGELEPDALVVSHGDGRTFALWYGASVLSPRADVAIISDTLIDWPWYRVQVARRHPGLVLPPTGQARSVARAVLIERHLDERPVYVTEFEPELAALFTVEPAGPLYRVSRLPGRASAMPAAATAGASSGRTGREDPPPAAPARSARSPR